MATSIPMARAPQTDGTPEAAPLTVVEREIDVRLSYPGKRTEQAILDTSPAQTRILWPLDHHVADGLSNRLYYGDNLPILASLIHAPLILGKVRLVYIDPPYATGGIFQSRAQEDAYTDILSGAHYLEFLRERLILLRELLASDGSIYVHLDKNMAFSMKVIMDEVYGPKNFRAWITRKKCNPKNYTSRSYGNVADYILFYTKTDNYVWNRPFEPWTPERIDKEYQYVDEKGRRYKKVPIHAPGTRRGATGQPWRGIAPPPGKHWQYTPEKLDELDARGDIYWSPNGNPRRKVYLDTRAGVSVQDIWLDFKDAHNQNSRITGYPTEKNADLLQRIISASSNQGDLVLDCFSGSGTTLAVASAMNRRWIGVDNSTRAIATTLDRFAHGLQPMGDFVTARNKPTAGSGDHHGSNAQQLALHLDGEVAEQQPSNDHIVIDDFALLAEQSVAHDIASALSTNVKRSTLAVME